MCCILKLHLQQSVQQRMPVGGFYVSPELGIDIHPVPYQRLGFKGKPYNIANAKLIKPIS